ncbi:MAG: Ig-like domain-containing protein, partial [Candidatus Kariarchaeaceae archaeon]
GVNISISEPFNIPTTAWIDGDYTIQFNAVDFAGNSNSSLFLLTLDSVKPMILLASPENNTYIFEGTVINFSIIDSHLFAVNYSVNGGSYIQLSHPFNFNSSSFNFIIDSTYPTIILNSPQNDSFILEGIKLDLIIFDTNLIYVNYSINMGPAIPFSSPFNISTLGWHGGNYTIQIYAQDMAGNSKSTWFIFSIDSKVPIIVLNDPLENSVCQSGTILDFTIWDQNLTQVNYSINGGASIPLFEPYDIQTTGWSDGDCSIQINALDLAGNQNSSMFFFIFDSTKPDIILETPNNNSIISNGKVIEFSINDTNLLLVNYSINGGENIYSPDEFNISTENWIDGNYSIHINALDLAGNTNYGWFFFTIDSALPSIEFDQSINYSIIPVGTIIHINVFDEHINKVMYSVDQGDYYLLTSPYIINTTSWSDGAHRIYVKANDSAGNEIVRWFEIIIDSVPPFVLSSQPQNQAIDIETNIPIIITFSESMNQVDFEDYLTFSASIEYSCIWEEDATVLNISFKPNNLAEGTTYSLEIDKQIKDLNGNPMISDFELEFTTKTSTPIPTPKSDESEFPYWILAIVAIVIGILILLFFLLTRRKGVEEEMMVKPEEEGPTVLEGLAEVSTTQVSDEQISWVHEEEQVPQVAPPPVIEPIKPQPRVKCPRCNNMFGIDTSSVPYIMNCPNCGLRGKVERK